MFKEIFEKSVFDIQHPNIVITKSVHEMPRKQESK